VSVLLKSYWHCGYPHGFRQFLSGLALLLWVFASGQALGVEQAAWLNDSSFGPGKPPPTSANWHPLNDHRIDQLDWRDGIWLSWPVANIEHDLLIFRKAWWRSAEAWIPLQDGQWQHQTLGFDHANQGREGSGRFLTLPLPGTFDRSQPIYLWLKHDRPTTLQIDTARQAEYVQQDLIYLRWIMLFFGILLALSIYHFLLFVWLRQRAFGLYVLYLLSVGGFFLAQEGLLFLWQWPGWSSLGSGVGNAFAAWTIAFATLFVADFVRLRSFAPRFERFAMRWPAHLLLLTGALSLIASGPALVMLSQISAIGALVLTPLVIAAGIAAWRQHEVAGIYVTVAWSLVVLAVCYRVLYGFGITPMNAITLYGTQIAVAIEAMLLAIGLAHRITMLRNERDQARAHLAAEHRLVLHREILNELGRGLVASRDADQVFSLTLAATEKAFASGGVLLLERYSGQVIARRGGACQGLPSVIDAPQLMRWRTDQQTVVVECAVESNRALILVLLASPFDAGPHLVQEFLEMALPALRNVDYLRTVQHKADFDNLTGLFARGHFLEQAERLLLTPEVEEVALAFMDLDYFKQINDRYGHAVGDEILVTVGKRIRLCLRQDELIGRHGGEEFVALFVGLNRTRAIALCERIRHQVGSTPCETRVGPIEVTLSIGLFAASTPVTLDRLLDQADQYLYQAKEQGRNQVVS
jgi:diguanylate cyclase (GGDEF)-like protein